MVEVRQAARIRANYGYSGRKLKAAVMLYYHIWTSPQVHISVVWCWESDQCHADAWLEGLAVVNLVVQTNGKRQDLTWAYKQLQGIFLLVCLSEPALSAGACSECTCLVSDWHHAQLEELAPSMCIFVGDSCRG